MLEIFYRSTGTLTATLTTSGGTGVSGATVTLTISQGATAISGVSWPVTMTDAGSGVYTYTVASTLLTTGVLYTAKITATKSGVTRYAEIPLYCVTDGD